MSKLNDDIAKQLKADPYKTIEKLTTTQIVALLKEASDKYYNTSVPLIPDDVFDMLKERLQKVDPKNAYLKEIGAPIPASDKVELPYFMGSLDKIKDDPKALQKWMKAYPGSVVVSDKLDGNSGMYVIEPNGKCNLYSRGDGFHGQNLNNLLPHLKLPVVKQDTVFAVRGEFIISKKNWETHSHIGANARNVVAGLLNKKTPDPVLTQLIDFVVYEVVQPKMTPSEGLQFLQQLGTFKVVHNVKINEPLTMDMLSSVLMERRTKSPYEIDGIVVYHDAVHKLQKGKNPPYGFAFKTIHTMTEAEVIVSDIEWNVSKDGYIKPTVLFPPVSIGGVTISRATGFNAAFIEKHVIGPGSRIGIIRSGDVIPHIVRVMTPAASGTALFPDVPYTWNETHIDIVVSETGKNSDMQKKVLEHFVSKLDIHGVGPGIVAKLVDGGIDTIPKLLNITKGEISNIPGLSGQSGDKTVAVLNHARDTVKCVDLMAASNIFGRGLGSRKLAAIIKECPGVLRRSIPAKSVVVAVEGIGETTADIFLENLPKFYALLDEIGIPCRTAAPAAPVAPPPAPAAAAPSAAAPAQVKAPKATPPTAATSSVTGKTFVFTGFRNKGWEDAIAERGGKVSTSVSKNTSVVVAADINENSGKISKARELGVQVISKETFEQMYM
jgi:DNA ligase (NAD+)